MDKIFPNTADRSIFFAVKEVLGAITDYKIGGVQWRDGESANINVIAAIALTELATVTSPHADNQGKYISTDTTAGNQFIIRVDFPDSFWALGAIDYNRVICNLYDDGNNVVAHRIFNLNTGDLDGYVDGYIYVEDNEGTGQAVPGIHGTVTVSCTFTAAEILKNTLGLKKIWLIDGPTSVFVGLSDWTDIYGITIKCSSQTFLTGGNAVFGNTTIEGFGSTLDLQNAVFDFNCTLRNLSKITASIGSSAILGTIEDCPDLDIQGTFIGSVYRCGIRTMGILGNAEFHECYQQSEVANSVLEFKVAGAAVISLYNYGGDIHIISMTNAGNVVKVYANGNTKITLEASNTLGTVKLIGTGILIDNSGAGTFVNQDDWNSNTSVTSIAAAYEGFCWYDEDADNTNTVPGVDGIRSNPVSSDTALRTLVDNPLIPNDINISGQINITQEWHKVGRFFGTTGFNSIFNFNNNDGADNVFNSLVLIGNISFEDDETLFVNCLINGVTGIAGFSRGCFFSGTIGIEQSTDGFNVDGGTIKGSCTFDFSIANSNANMHGMKGDFTFDGAASAGVLVNLSLAGGTVTLNNCTEGTFNIEGVGRILTTGTTGAEINRDNLIDQLVRDGMALPKSSLIAATGAAGSVDEAVVDPMAELTVGLPPINPKLREAIMLTYMAFRNLSDETNNLQQIRNAAGTVIAKKTMSDIAGLFSSGGFEAP